MGYRYLSYIAITLAVKCKENFTTGRTSGYSLGSRYDLNRASTAIFNTSGEMEWHAAVNLNTISPYSSVWYQYPPILSLSQLAEPLTKPQTYCCLCHVTLYSYTFCFISGREIKACGKVIYSGTGSIKRSIINIFFNIRCVPVQCL